VGPLTIGFCGGGVSGGEELAFNCVQKTIETNTRYLEQQKNTVLLVEEMNARRRSYVDELPGRASLTRRLNTTTGEEGTGLLCGFLLDVSFGKDYKVWRWC